MTNYEIATLNVNALVDQIKINSMYPDTARQNAYTAGYLNMLLIKLYHESDVVKTEIDALLNSYNRKAA